MSKIVMVAALTPKVPVIMLMLLMFDFLSDVAHFLSCVINFLLELGEPKHLFLVLLYLLMNSFEVVDLPIEFVILVFEADGLPLLVPCL
jgi:hypothetical protein